MGRISPTQEIISHFWGKTYPVLKKTHFGITFPSPIGLAAGFDYEARLTGMLPFLGFGFHTIGTITNLPYNGNPPPMLSRLIDRKSLIVNKGFKNLGADETIKKLKGKDFLIPVGISIGKTNHKEINTQEKAINDIIACFQKFRLADLPISYYELNISCPNLFGPVTFYPPKNLDHLLQKIDTLKLKKPIFVKMPITLSDHETISLTAVIKKHSPKGIIIGNLHKEDGIRGGLSGKPTFIRSNSLIHLIHSRYSGMFIIGCGGVFSADDAREKFNSGASLVQLITGMIYEGPGLVSTINKSLANNENYRHQSV